jgi:sugar lactone lactonase YvrE
MLLPCIYNRIFRYFRFVISSCISGIINLKYVRFLFGITSAIPLFFIGHCYAQTITQKNNSQSPESAKIQYVSQWPSPESRLRDNSFKHKLKNILLGTKKQELVRPVSMIVDNQDNYWILDQQMKSVYLTSKESYKFPRYIEKKNYQLSSLVGICNYHKNEILFTDSYLNKIFVVNSQKKECDVLNDSLKLDKPTGIAYNRVNNEIWITETGAHRLLVLNEKGEIKKKIGKRGKANGEFNFPTHIWIDKSGNVYVVDAMNFRIQVFNKEGEILSVFGSNGDATGTFASPKGIATDSYGHIYVADALFHAVQIFDINGNFLYTFGSQGQGEGEFWMPAGIYIDDSDKIYVSDSYNSRIQVFQLTIENKK